MGMGIPHICNAGVGDVSDIVNSDKLGICISDFSRATYEAAAIELCKAKTDAIAIRAKAFEQYSLEAGVAKYYSVYQKLLNPT